VGGIVFFALYTPTMSKKHRNLPPHAAPAASPDEASRCADTDPDAALSPEEPSAAADPAVDPAAASCADVEIVPVVEATLSALQSQVDQQADALLRAKAETENVRRRMQEEVTKAHKFAAEKFAGELLAVKDSLEAALANDQQDITALRSGVELTLKQLVAAFEKSGLYEIAADQQKFDPRWHQAISQVPAPGEPNRVIQVLQKGYALNERVLRPALVIVSKTPDASD
jgi:molecular chaperone GrpE